MNKKQAVKISLNHSSFHTVLFGVSQGSVVEILLNLVYLNNIQISSSHVEFHLFANNTCVFDSGKSLYKNCLSKTFHKKCLKLADIK